MTSVGRPRRWMPPRQAWPVVVSTLATLVILAVAAAMSLQLRAATAARAGESAENLLTVIERDIARNLEVIELSLDAVVDGYGRADVMALPSELRRMVLFDRSVSATSIGVLVVYDENGVITIDSQGDVPRVIQPVSDREYFQAMKQGDIGLYISAPYRSRLLGEQVVGLSRRLSRPDGSFAGVAHATIQLSYFSRLFDRLRLGSKAVINLARLDGTVLFRRAPFQENIPSLLASPVFKRIQAAGEPGHFVASSGIDGIERLYNFTRVGHFPLLLTIGVTTDTIFAEWLWETTLSGFVLLAVMCGLIGLTVVLTRELARRTAAERKLTQANSELGRLAVTDGLTGLGNRRAFDDAFGRDCRRARRLERAVGLVLVDVDYFKSFNDRHGHSAGDEVLIAVARVIATVARESGGSAYRLGGEEFGLVVPDRTAGFTYLVAEAIRRGVREIGHPHPGSPLGVLTVSLGTITVGDETASAAFDRCDQALYRAKSAGRNTTMGDGGAARAA